MPRRVALVVSLAVAGALVCCQHATAAPSQTEALQRLAASLDPKSNLGWSTSGSDPCSQSDYPGVTCVDGNVATIDLSGQVLPGGKLPGGAPGATPEEEEVWEALSSLSSLNLAETGISGSVPAGLAAVKALSSVDLHGNQLTGSIPPAFSGLTSLSLLDVSGNELMCGSLPDTLWESGNVNIDTTFIGLDDPCGFGRELFGNYTDVDAHLPIEALPADPDDVASGEVPAPAPMQLPDPVVPLDSLPDDTYDTPAAEPPAPEPVPPVAEPDTPVADPILPLPLPPPAEQPAPAPVPWPEPPTADAPAVDAPAADAPAAGAPAAAPPPADGGDADAPVAQAQPRQPPAPSGQQPAPPMPGSPVYDDGLAEDVDQDDGGQSDDDGGPLDDQLDDFTDGICSCATFGFGTTSCLDAFAAICHQPSVSSQIQQAHPQQQHRQLRQMSSALAACEVYNEANAQAGGAALVATAVSEACFVGSCAVLPSDVSLKCDCLKDPGSTGCSRARLAMCLASDPLCLPFQRIADRSSIDSIAAVSDALASCPAAYDPSQLPGSGAELNLTVVSMDLMAWQAMNYSTAFAEALGELAGVPASQVTQLGIRPVIVTRIITGAPAPASGSSGGGGGLARGGQQERGGGRESAPAAVNGLESVTEQNSEWVETAVRSRGARGGSSRWREAGPGGASPTISRLPAVVVHVFVETLQPHAFVARAEDEEALQAALLQQGVVELTELSGSRTIGEDQAGAYVPAAGAASGTGDASQATSGLPIYAIVLIAVAIVGLTASIAACCIVAACRRRSGGADVGAASAPSAQSGDSASFDMRTFMDAVKGQEYRRLGSSLADSVYSMGAASLKGLKGIGSSSADQLLRLGSASGDALSRAVSASSSRSGTPTSTGPSTPRDGGAASARGSAAATAAAATARGAASRLRMMHRSDTAFSGAGPAATTPREPAAIARDQGSSRSAADATTDA